ncbi:MAG: radical SAM protein [Desulfobacterales bacterium]|nr:radical SAM protein [Desulfobacterales bacterium]MDD4392321.1 radical SAM protein [Desulfobacterales bacterium]
MTILLIQPPIRDFYLTAKRTIPYGLASIASTLEQHGFTVALIDSLATSKSRVIDLPDEMAYLKEYYGTPDVSPFALFHHYRHFGYSFEHIKRLARQSRPFLIGISSLFTAYSAEALATAEAVKSVYPDIPVVLGGHHPTAMPESVMKCRAVDFVLRGEGEVSMAKLADALKNGRELTQIPGIVFRKGNGELHVSDPAMIENLDACPLPATHLVNHRFYQRKKRAAMAIVASRGCPMACSYCALGNTASRYRQRSVSSVFNEIRTAADQYDIGFIDFEDENLALDKGWLLGLLNNIKALFGSGRVELRAMNGLYPPSLDEELIKAMKEAGFKTLNLSLGSTSKEQLIRFNRPDIRYDFEQAVTIARQYDMEVVGYVIAGAPGQYPEQSVADILYLLNSGVIAGISIYYPAPGSRDFQLCERTGILPRKLSLMRSTAVPVSDTTRRTESVTLLRLGRIANFIKSLADEGIKIPGPLPMAQIRIEPDDSRRQKGIKLLQGFLSDGHIRGMTPHGEIVTHRVSAGLTNQFIQGLGRILPVAPVK